MTKAIAQNGIVTDIARVDPYTIFQPAYAAQFIDAPDDVQPGWLWDGATFTAPPQPPFDRTAAALQIDEAVAAIYGRFTRFQLEYTERESQAQSYKDAGYTGEVPPRVAEFATPAGMPAQAATDLILAQAANLRGAQGSLSALRMRKYEVLRAATDAQAQAVAAEILAGVAAVGANVS